MGVAINILDILTEGLATTKITEWKPKVDNVRISDDRIKHMHGVAELMYLYADVFKCIYLTPDQLYVLGLNHDIGYIYGKEDHELQGGQLFASFCEFGPQNEIAKNIFYHGSTPNEYKERHMCSNDEIPKELILLWWADMMVESTGDKAGEVVGFNERLNSIEQRFGKDSNAYRICSETIDWLVNYMAMSILTAKNE